MMQNPLETKYKYWPTRHSNYSAQFNQNNNNGVPIADLYNILAVTVCTHWVSPVPGEVEASSSLLLLLKFFGWLFRCDTSVWGWALCLLPRAGLADSEKHFHPQLVCSADTAIYAPSGPLGVETKSASLQEPWSVTPCVVLSSLTLPLPILAETSSSVCSGFVVQSQSPDLCVGLYGR